MKLLAALARGDKSLLPADFPKNRIIHIPERIIRKDKAAEFKAECIRLLATK